MLCLKRKKLCLTSAYVASVVCERTEKMLFEARAFDHSLVAEAYTPMFVQYWAIDISIHCNFMQRAARNRMEKFKSTRCESLSEWELKLMSLLVVQFHSPTNSEKEREEKYTLTRLYNKKIYCIRKTRLVKVFFFFNFVFNKQHNALLWSLFFHS